MPDARQPGNPAPEDWGQAFAALPLDAPPAGGWNRVVAALPARRSRARVWIPAAAAACLALAVAVPWRDTSPDPSATMVARAPAATTPAEPPATPVVSPTPSPDPATAIASNGEDAPAPAPLADTPPRDAPLATTGSRRVSGPPEATERRRAANAGTRDSKPADGALANAGGRAPAPMEGGDAAAGGAPAALETLYAESARLEALLSQIRDDRVASGPAMALSAALNERVAGIDVALSQPDLTPTTRVDLWRERVAVLQRLTGVESTQRWMAANGYPADGAVAQVY
ncbi:hypothetical protein [Pseudoxanthomonas sp. z9]|uniref:hypothetical protein n=1 Tax=Pseudoxanthomonas sp. z9 TaxID=2584942 RepID=UPI0011437B23|nr:hypothetical protein [Pseudoxanthomonas sp. z9]